jgi:hypothetical protein
MRFVLFVIALALVVTWLRTAYDKVAEQIAHPDPNTALAFHATPMPPPDRAIG